MTPRRALLAWFAALIAVHAMAGLWQPLQGEDWLQLTWSGQRAGWIGGHFTAGDLASALFAVSAPAFAAISALATAALVLGGFVVAARRLPRATWDDTLGVIAISAMIWIAQPRVGFTCFHRPNVAAHVLGCAAAVWLIAPLRCGWRIAGWRTPVLALVGLIAATTTKQIALASVVGVAIGIWRAPTRSRGAWLVLAVTVTGTVIEMLDPPSATIARTFKRGLESNLLIMNLPLRQSAGVVSLLLLLALARFALAAWRPGMVPSGDEATDDAAPSPREARWWFWTWLALCAIALVGPRYSEASLLPATMALAIGALPFVLWLSRTRALRFVLAGLFVAIPAACWATALATYAEMHDEFEARLAQLRATPPGQVAVIAPYARFRPDGWTLGEDWSSASRQLIGIAGFGVSDIDFTYPFAGYEANARISTRLEIHGLDDARRRALEPAVWATDVITARSQFERFHKAAARLVGETFDARLVVDDARLVFAERGTRPLDVIRLEHGVETSPSSTRANLVDASNRIRISMPAALASTYSEAYLVHDGEVHRLRYEGGFLVPTVTTSLYAVVACAPTHCLLVDAFIPRI